MRCGNKPVGVAGEVAVEVGVEHRHEALERIDAERVHRRNEIDLSEQPLRVRHGELFEPHRQAVADVQSFELVAVNARDHRHARPVAAAEHGALQMQRFAVGKLQCDDGVLGNVHLKEGGKGCWRLGCWS